jgi:hypothetical protein
MIIKSELIIHIRLAMSQHSKAGDLSLATVFSVTELAEGVLAKLPLRDLLLAQRVCTQWRNIIAGSSILQQQLFFRAVADTPSEPYFNPLLQDVFPSLLSLKPTRSIFEDIEKQPWYLDLSLRAAVLNPQASRRRMFPVQPPARIDTIIATDHTQTQDTKKNGTFRAKHDERQKNGATMALVYDTIVAWASHSASAGGAAVWDMSAPKRISMQPEDDAEPENGTERHMKKRRTNTVIEEDLKSITIYLWGSASCISNYRKPSPLLIGDQLDDLLEFGESMNRPKPLCFYRPCHIVISFELKLTFLKRDYNPSMVDITAANPWKGSNVLWFSLVLRLCPSFNSLLT